MTLPPAPARWMDALARLLGQMEEAAHGDAPHHVTALNALAERLDVAAQELTTMEPTDRAALEPFLPELLGKLSLAHAQLEKAQSAMEPDIRRLRVSSAALQAYGGTKR